MSRIVNLTVIIFVFYSICFSQTKSESDDFSYAIKLYEEKFYDLAAQQFIKFASNHPGSSKLDEAGYYAGMSLYQLGEYDNARIEFQSAAVNYPKSKKAPEGWFMSGECYAKLGNYAEAAKSYETVKTLYANNARAAEGALNAGKAHIFLKNFEKADQLFSLIQDRYVESVAYFPSLIAHGELFIKSGKLSNAKDKLLKVLQSNAEYELKGQANYLLGELSEQQGYINDAEKYYNDVRKSYSKCKDFVPASLNLAKLKIQSGNYNDAIQIINDGLDESKTQEIKNQLNELLGDAYFLNKKYALAQKAYQTSLKEAKGSDKNRRDIKNAYSWYYQKNISNAISTIENKVLNLPDTLDVYLAMTLDMYYNWLGEKGNFRLAINHLNDLKNTPHFDNHYRSILVKFLDSDKNWAGIIRELEQVIKTGQKNSEIDDYVFNLALAYEHFQDYEKSLYYLNKLLLEYPSSKYITEAKNQIDYINTYYLKKESMGVGQLALLIGDLLNQKNKSTLQFQLGKMIFHNLIDYKGAIQQFENALSLQENSNIKADILYYIGKSYYFLGLKKENSDAERNSFLTKAKDYYSKAMENISTSSAPDEVASALVECGILLDNPSFQKQINYYSALIKNYPKSKLIESWHSTLAEIYYTNSDFGNAKNEYELLCNQFRNSNLYPNYAFKLAKLKQLKKESVLEDYRIIAGDYPNSEHAAEALYNMAEIYFTNGQFKEASQLYEKLIYEYYYTDFAITAEQNIADTYIASQKYDEAIKFYSNELKRIPIGDEVLRRQISTETNINALFKLGKAYFLSSNWQMARYNLSTYLKLSSDDYFRNEAYLLLGDTYFNLNDLNSAIVSYSKVNSDNVANYKDAMFKKGNCQLELRLYNDAASTFGSLIKVNDTEEIFAKYIIAQLKGGKRSAAAKSIKSFKAKYSNQKNYLAQFEFEEGEYLRINKNYNEALKNFQNVKKYYKNTDYVDDAAYHEALVYITLNKQKEALDILTTFAKTYRESNKKGAVFNTLGGIYFRSEKYESAILSFKSALDNELDRELKKQVISNLIKTYTYVSFWDAALALSRDYINEYPEADDIIDKKITISQAYVNLNQFDRAVELLRQARTEADSEKEPEIQFYIGEAYLRAGQYENAIAEFVKIPLLSRKTKLQWEASALYYSGQAYEKMGKISEAIRMYEEIVKRPGIDLILKKDAKKRIEQIKS